MYVKFAFHGIGEEDAGPSGTGGEGGYIEVQDTVNMRFQGLGRPAMRGVDLRLDQFDLNEVKKVQMEAPAELEKCIALGDAFWSGLKQDAVFKPEDKSLLKDVFCPALCDRQSEGEKFVPPDASFSYVARLRDLVKEEESVRRRRKEHFFSEGFMMGSPGWIFPSSWTPAFEIARGRTPVRVPEGRATESLFRRRDYEKEAALLEQVLKSAAPVFDKSTEEGMRFRIYRIGSLEFRSTQEPDEKEQIGAVFSIHTSLQGNRQGKFKKSQKLVDQERVTKVVEYVERAFSGAANAGNGTCYHRYYLVLETDKGTKVLTELLHNGRVEWVEDADFEVRNALAKVTRSMECRNGATVRELKAFRDNIVKEVARDGVSKAACKRYVQNAAALANGEAVTALS